GPSRLSTPKQAPKTTMITAIDANDSMSTLITNIIGTQTQSSSAATTSRTARSRAGDVRRATPSGLIMILARLIVADTTASRTTPSTTPTRTAGPTQSSLQANGRPWKLINATPGSAIR